ncbi:unnamed protein product [Arabis nemorensis]|uniref:Uncharacterized protein n=1 Tax=Arabis nemorensis TaxID=586526 RepID=A0A565BER9_9BRAS|nr:unnamed protein product [Arabis nemorensis]
MAKKSGGLGDSTASLPFETQRLSSVGLMKAATGYIGVGRSNWSIPGLLAHYMWNLNGFVINIYDLSSMDIYDYCGPNAYCDINIMNANCTCLKGYYNTTDGCVIMAPLHRGENEFVSLLNMSFPHSLKPIQSESTRMPEDMHRGFGYMSPEYSTKSDIFNYKWEAGQQILLCGRQHESLCGRKWVGGNWEEIMDQVILESSASRAEQVRRCIGIGLCAFNKVQMTDQRCQRLLQCSRTKNLSFPILNRLGSSWVKVRMQFLRIPTKTVLLQSTNTPSQKSDHDSQVLFKLVVITA